MSSVTRTTTRHQEQGLRSVAADSTGGMAQAVHPPRADTTALAEAFNRSSRVAQLHAVSAEANGQAVVQRLVRVSGAARSDSLPPVAQPRTRTLAGREAVSSALTDSRQTDGNRGLQTTGPRSRTFRLPPLGRSGTTTEGRGRTGQTDGRPDRQDQLVERRGEQAEIAGQIPPMSSESRTRVGFEVEIARSYLVPNTTPEDLEPVINRTLATCSVNGREILQMLVDDPRQEQGGTRVQIEFRTPPLEFAAITPQLNRLVREAIHSFPIGIFQAPQESRHHGTPQAPLRSASLPRGRSGTPAREVAPVLTWTPSETLRSPRVQALMHCATTSSRLSTNQVQDLAQHATTSIEIDAFSRISRARQALLFMHGSGVTSAQGLVDRLAARTSAAGGDRIDTSTRGRNRERVTVKTPIESLIAADSRLAVPDEQAIAGRRGTQVANAVTVGGGTRFSLGDIRTVAGQIRRNGAFPTMQGQSLDPNNPDAAQGFRAVAEKLQPPLRDASSGRPRVLVEHRSGGLQSAVNAALLGNSRLLAAIRDAARAMDRTRRPRPSLVTSRTGRSSAGTGGTGGTGRNDAQDRMEQTERAVSEDHRGTTGNAGTSRTRGGGGAGAPAWQAPLHPLNLADLVVHAGEGIAWAGGHGTYSPEFEEFRDHPDEAFARVIALGLAPGAALALRQQVTGAMRAAGILDAGGEVINAGYVEAQQQQDIFAHVGGGLGDQLWALLRYARAIGL